MMTDTQAVKELKAIINSALTEQVQQVSMQGRIYRQWPEARQVTP